MKTRIISALVMLIVALPILILGGLPFKILLMILGGISLYELINIREKEKPFPLTLKIISFILLEILIYFGYNKTINYSLNYQYIVLIFCILLIPIVLINNNEKYNINDALYLVGNTIFISVIFSIFIMIREFDLNYFIYLLLITIFTDTFALVSGRFIGKNKLCEKISPNKTIEGAIGGSIFGTIIATTFYIMIINSNANIVVIALITLLFSIIGQIGDLFFSSIKRYYKVKDFSNLIPGHGGILDRFDSLIFVVMLYMLFIKFL